MRIAEKDPPYIPAAKQDTIRMSAVSGSNEKDTGISSAIAIGGLNPGIAPITNPTETPRSIAKKLFRDNMLTK